MAVDHSGDVGTCLQMKTVAKSVLTTVTSELNILIEETMHSIRDDAGVKLEVERTSSSLGDLGPKKEGYPNC